jgi:hypothetical protein
MSSPGSKKRAEAMEMVNREENCFLGQKEKQKLFGLMLPDSILNASITHQSRWVIAHGY